VDVYVDVNLTEVKDWNVLLFTDFYMYIVFVLYRLYLFYLCVSFSLSGYRFY